MIFLKNTVLTSISIRNLLLLLIFCTGSLFARQFDPQTGYIPVDQRNGKFVKDSTYFYNWDVLSLGWANVERYKVTERDQFGNYIRALTTAFDQESATWVNQKRRENNYYDSINPHYILGFIWDSKAENWKMSDSIYYNTQRNPVISWYKIWDANKFRFSQGRRVFYQYTENNLPFQYDTDNFDTLSGSWKKYQQVHFTHNENDLLHQQLLKLWKDNFFWEDSLRTTYMYNNENHVGEVLQESWTDEGAWENTRKTIQFYTGFGSPEEVIQLKWNGQTQGWDSLSYSYYTYDGQERPETIIQQKWDDYVNGWLNHSKTMNFYDESGNRVSILQQYWDAFGNFWVNLSNSAYSFDEDGNAIGFTYQFWDEDSEQWFNIYKDESWWSFFEPASVQDASLPQISVFPIPALQFIQIDIQEFYTDCQLTIYNSNGIPVIRQSIVNPDQRIDVSALPAGMYFVELVVDGRFAVRKVMVN
ncbi:MAG: T9SS type A sorting domain-containing protein [Bacteroidales bacterium]|nr:T9SS type A sorting domain-containing protein [Bacteroidales bacterium]